MRFTEWKLVLDGVKRRKGSLASEKKNSLAPFKQQRNSHGYRVVCFDKHQIDPLLVQWVAVINAC